ncbi:hypothetical protein JYT74_03150, partial [Crocinitomix catalasitica]|nr:hypothetical protein [Crocinitomix catalasitica]
ITLILYFYKSSREDQKLYKYYLPAFYLKIVGGVAFALIYIYYYGFGDTFLYHRGAMVLSDVLANDPGTYLSLLLSEGRNFAPDLRQYAEQIQYSGTYEEWFMVKILSPIEFISFKSYLVVTLFTSILSFWGAWKLFRVFADILKTRIFLAFFAAFLIPSVVFWGGGVLKDTVTLATLNYIIYVLYFSFFKKNFSFVALAKIVVAAYVIIGLKAYIFIALIPGLVFAFYLQFRKSIDSIVIRIIVGPILFAGLTIGAFMFLQNVATQSEKYDVEKLESRVVGFHTWHRDVGGSTYDLGEIEYTTGGVASKIPAGLNVTFFRPYVWEAGNPVVFISSLESLSFLLLFLYVLYKTNLTFFKRLSTEPILYGLFFYCLIFGFAIGFTSYNFGALIRYKIPIFALSVFILFYIIDTTKVKSTDKKQLSQKPSYRGNNN